MIEIFTIGYEGLDPVRFFGLLRRSGVEMIVDVRELPLSRKRGFSKTSLAALCDQEDVEYVHFPELGCPREVRQEYREDSDWTNYTVQFKRHLYQQDEPLDRLAKLANKRRICLLCFERDFNTCHRSYVAEAVAPLIGGDVKISHMTGPIRGRVVVVPEAVAA